MTDRQEQLSSQRPYLLRAMYEWMTDNGLTPHIVVDATHDGVSIPVERVENGRIVLNLSPTATRDLVIGNECAEFGARFGGVSRQLRIPIVAVLGIYARETGAGMIFSEDVESTKSDSEPADPVDPRDNVAGARPTLTLVK